MVVTRVLPSHENRLDIGTDGVRIALSPLGSVLARTFHPCVGSACTSLSRWYSNPYPPTSCEVRSLVYILIGIREGVNLGKLLLFLR